MCFKVGNEARYKLNEYMYGMAAALGESSKCSVVLESVLVGSIPRMEYDHGASDCSLCNVVNLASYLRILYLYYTYLTEENKY